MTEQEVLSIRGLLGCLNLLDQPLFQLQDEGSKKAEFPPQPCGESFKTRAKRRIDVTGDITIAIALRIILMVYNEALDKAKRFCQLMSEEDCKEVEFVKYDFFDSDSGSNDDGTNWAEVELVIVWKCKKA